MANAFLRALASLPYAGVVRLRHALYDHGLLPQWQAPLPVVSVGGIEAGGTGKTPMAAHLVRRLLTDNVAPGLLTRGYRRTATGLQVRPVGARAEVALLGDEAVMLVRSGLDMAIAACPQRRLGAQALHNLGCQVAVMDDGFSHRQLRRDLNIVMVRAEMPLTRARLLPWGSLRQPLSTLRQADIVVLHAREGTGPLPTRQEAAWRALLEEQGCRAQVLTSHMGAATVLDAAGDPQPVAGVPVVAAAGTARPQEVRCALRQMGADVRAFWPFADHHPYPPSCQEALRRSAQEHHAQALVVTAKDAVKLPHALGVPLWTLHRPLVVQDPGDALGAALRRLTAR